MIQNINATDRVPVEVLDNGAIRYGVYDENGALLRYEYIKREDDPVNVGTNVNKVLFDLIDSNTNEELAERSRVDRYNIPTLTHDIGPVSGDIIPKIWDANIEYYKYTKNGIILEGKSVYNSYDKAVYKICDGDASYTYVQNQLFNTDPQRYNTFFMLEFPSAIKISKMKLKITLNEGITAKLKGSVDDTVWVDLYTLSSMSNLTEITLENQDFYKYYRIDCELDMNYNNKSVFFYEWQVSEYYANISNNLNIDLDIDNYFIGQRVLIQTPSQYNNTLNTYININNIGKKLINSTLETNKKYELIYNGISFDPKLMEDTISNNFSIKTGTISDSAVIPKTTGYNNYMYLASINIGECEGESQPNGIKLVKMGIKCSVDQSDRVVTAQVGMVTSSTTYGGLISYTSATANYTEIAWN